MACLQQIPRLSPADWQATAGSGCCSSESLSWGLVCSLAMAMLTGRGGDIHLAAQALVQGRCPCGPPWSLSLHIQSLSPSRRLDLQDITLDKYLWPLCITTASTPIRCQASVSSHPVTARASHSSPTAPFSGPFSSRVSRSPALHPYT